MQEKSIGQGMEVDLIIPGGNGNYSSEYLQPAIADGREHQLGMLSAARVISVDIAPETDEEYQAKIAERLGKPVKEVQSYLGHVVMDLTKPEYTELAEVLLPGRQAGRRAVFYCATAPWLFPYVAEGLDKAELARENFLALFEKPIGHDLASSVELQRRLFSVLGEGNVAFVDHYLCKESMDDIAALRESERFNSDNVVKVVISTREARGLDGRAGYFDKVGLGRDVAQNHLTQLFVALACDPKKASHSLLEARLDRLNSLRPYTPEEVERYTVRAQYERFGAVPGYLEEPGVQENSGAETYLAVELQVPGWEGTKWVLEAGKRMSKREGTITVQYRDGSTDEINIHRQSPNRPSTHATLIEAALRDERDRFVTGPEVEASWRFWDKIFQAWAANPDGLLRYEAGSDGPKEALTLLQS